MIFVAVIARKWEKTTILVNLGAITPINEVRQISKLNLAESLMHITLLPSLKKIGSHLCQLLHGNEVRRTEGRTDEPKLIYPDFFFEKAGHNKYRINPKYFMGNYKR